MSLSNAAENDWLLLFFNNTNWANVGDAVGIRGSTVAGSWYPSLHTADPGEAGTQNTSEIAYTGYTRIGVARSAGGWTVSGTSPTQATNTAAITFPTCGVTGGTATHTELGRDSSGAGESVFYGALVSPLVITTNVTPSYAIGQLALLLD